jgi:ubiquinone/menaquinone biosynthesis C-methylase UbiE
MLKKNGERVLPDEIVSKEQYLIYLRHLFAYDYAKERILDNYNVLEIGSGEGYGAYRLSKKKGLKKIIAIDVDRESIENAKNKYNSNKVEFKHYDGDRLPFEDNTFDMVISFQVIEHIADDKNYILEAYRVLKKNGLFILTTPNRVYRLKEGQKPWNRFHIREYDYLSLKDILSYNFRHIEIFGLKGNEEIQKIEVERVNKIQKFISLDPLNLRNILPEKVKIVVANLFNNKTFGVQKEEDFKFRYKIEQHYLTNEDYKNSLDLLAVCKK